MARKWSKAYSNGYKAGKAGTRFPAAKWRRYSVGFKKGYRRGASQKSSYGRSTSYGRRRKTYYRKRRY